jgi:hypothetical protein
MPNALFKRFNGTQWEEFKFPAYDSEKLGGVLPEGYSTVGHGHLGTDITIGSSPTTILNTTHYLAIKDENNKLHYSNINFNQTHGDAYLRRDGTWQSLQISNISDLQTSLDAKLNLQGGTMTGILYPQNNTSYTTGQARRIVLSTANPSGGGNGDVWIKYTA